MKKNSTLSCSVSSYCRLRLCRLGLRSFALSAFLLAGAVNASAQSELKKMGNFIDNDFVCPGFFSYDGKSHLLETLYDADHVSQGPYSFNVYDSNLNKERQITFGVRPHNIVFFDYNQGLSGYDSYIGLTQTLFNKDDKFEAIVGYFDSDYNYETLSIVQEDGTVLFTFPEKFEYQNTFDELKIFKLGDSYYFSKDNYDRTEKILYKSIYRIDREGSSGLTFVKKIKKMSVSPTVLDRSTPVTVDFKEGEGQHEVRVVTAGGKTVHKESVDGASSVTLDTSRWGSGMNIVTVRDKNGKTESCKVIVK